MEVNGQIQAVAALNPISTR